MGHKNPSTSPLGLCVLVFVYEVLGYKCLLPLILCMYCAESTLLVCRKDIAPLSQKAIPDGNPITAPVPKSQGIPSNLFLFITTFFLWFWMPYEPVYLRVNLLALYCKSASPNLFKRILGFKMGSYGKLLLRNVISGFKNSFLGSVWYCCLNNSFHCLNNTTLIFTTLFHLYVFPQYLNNVTRTTLPNDF